MALSENQKKYLRGLGHRLKPIVIIADAGLTTSVAREVETSILHHELIKVSIRVGDREARAAVIASLCAEKSTELVQRIGNIALLYRENPERKNRIRLPN